MRQKIYIGCSGFSNRDWKGYFYPDDVASKDQLAYYTTIFSTVEINTTFYRIPRITTLENWYNRSREGFGFFVKIPKTITHIKRLLNTKAETTEFCQHISTGLQDKLTGFLFQLPPSYHFSIENLEKVVQTVDPSFLNVVEFRHESWWTAEVMQRLESENIVFCGVSHPTNIHDEFISNHPTHAYYRLHGVPVMFKSEYTETELYNLAREIKKSGRDTYIYFNNTWGTAAIKNALYLKKILAVD